MWNSYRHLIEHIEVESGALAHIPAWIRKQGFRRPLIVSDMNTSLVAGRALCAYLDIEEQLYNAFTFPLSDSDLVADETAVGLLMSAFEPANDLIVAVGSGTLGDLCKYVAHKADRPYIVAATAPSMDGYASSGAAMTLKGMKVTPQARTPRAIFCDIDILKAAPMPLIAAGLGDMLGKITSMADWRLSALLTGEEIPPDIAALIDAAVKRCSESAADARLRKPEAIARIAEGLILSGLAMSLYGDSRPASGMEHHLSHYWEIRFLAENRPPVLHGLKVGVAALCALRLWKSLPETPTEPVQDTSADIERLIFSRYRDAAPAILSEPNPEISFPEIKKHWADIRALADSLPAPEEVEALLSELDAPLVSAAIGVNADMLRESILLARERKKTFTLLQLLGNLGLLESAGQRLTADYARSALAKTRCFVLSLEGTVCRNGRLLPHSLEFLKAVKDSGRDYVFFTNDSSRSRQYYLDQLKDMGIDLAPEKLLTSTQVAVDYLKTRRAGKRVWCAGTQDMLEQFRAGGIDPQADNPEIVILGFDTTLTYDKLQKIYEARRKGAELMALSRDLLSFTENGPILDCGALSAMFTAIFGSIAQSFGKPTRKALTYVLRQTGCEENELCFVGNRLDTDMAATAGGPAVSAWVLNGENIRGELSKYPAAAPNIIVGNLKELSTYL